MDLLIDTNIILDLALNRENFSHTARQLFTKIENKNDNAFITASTVTDLFYIIRKAFKNNYEKIYEIFGDILSLVDILPVNEADITEAFIARWKDFEDCVLFMTAIHNDISHNNAKQKRFHG